MKRSHAGLLFSFLLLFSTSAFSQANGKLQIHFMNVGQGDGAVLDRIPQFVPGILKASVVPRTGLTPYARTGNGPILGFAFLTLVAFTIARLRTRNNA